MLTLLLGDFRSGKSKYLAECIAQDVANGIPVKLTDAWTGEVVAHKVMGEYVTSVARHDTAVFIIEPEF